MRALDSFGFSLVEILISMLVLSIGIMGAIKMQLASAQSSQQANYYSTATELASEMADKIRGNVGSGGHYLHVDFQAGKNTPSSATCFSQSCNRNQLADAEISEWLERIQVALPNAHAVICRDSAPWSGSTGKLKWECSGSDTTSVVVKLGWTVRNESNNTEKIPPPLLAFAI